MANTKILIVDDDVNICELLRIYLEKEGNVERLVLEVFPRAAVLKQKGVADAESYCKEQIKKVNATLLPHQRVNKIIVRDSDFDRTPSMKIKRPQMM